MTVRKSFEEELFELKNELIEMCRITENMIDNSIKALIEKDASLARSVGETDSVVDDMELDIEKKCIHIILRRQPVAKDLREVSSALKMITDIERIGDQASDIGEIVASMPGDKYIKELTHIKKMGALAVKMVHDSVNSFIKNDEKLADSTIKLDDEMDELFETVKNELIELIKKDGKNCDQAILFMMIAKYLERIGDHAVNVSEWTKYNETGVHIKY